VITAHGGAEWLRDRGSAEWRPVGGGSSRPRHHGRAQLQREGEPGTGLWRGGGTARLTNGSQEIYNVIEISLIIDASEPGQIGGLACASVTGAMIRSTSNMALKPSGRGACKRSRIVILASSKVD